MMATSGKSVEFQAMGEGLRQVRDMSSLDRKFSHICTHNFTFDAEEVTKVSLKIVVLPDSILRT